MTFTFPSYKVFSGVDRFPLKYWYWFLFSNVSWRPGTINEIYQSINWEEFHWQGLPIYFGRCKEKPFHVLKVVESQFNRSYLKMMNFVELSPDSGKGTSLIGRRITSHCSWWSQSGRTRLRWGWHSTWRTCRQSNITRTLPILMVWEQGPRGTDNVVS